MKRFLCILFTGLSISIQQGLAQLPDTDIFLASLKKEKNTWTFGEPVNITNRKGYDNQPAFSPDGKSILFVSIVDTTQSDVYRYEISAKKITAITNTKESEYSPAFTPDGKKISVVRVDRDSGQRFYTMPLSHPENPGVIHGTDSIGYSCWLNDSLLAMFILGPANTLQVLNTNTSERTLVASDIGRCLKNSPDKNFLYFVLKSNEQEWFIYSMRISDHKLVRMIRTISGAEDFALLPDGRFLLGSEGMLYSFLPGADADWIPVADFRSTVKSFYRIAVSPQGNWLALVAYTGKKP